VGLGQSIKTSLQELADDYKTGKIDKSQDYWIEAIELVAMEKIHDKYSRDLFFYWAWTSDCGIDLSGTFYREPVEELLPPFCVVKTNNE